MVQFSWTLAVNLGRIVRYNFPIFLNWSELTFPSSWNVGKGVVVLYRNKWRAVLYILEILKRNGASEVMCTEGVVEFGLRGGLIVAGLSRWTIGSNVGSKSTNEVLMRNWALRGDAHWGSGRVRIEWEVEFCRIKSVCNRIERWIKINERGSKRWVKTTRWGCVCKVACACDKVWFG